MMRTGMIALFIPFFINLIMYDIMIWNCQGAASKDY